MVPEKSARLRELVSLVARENNPRKRRVLATELQLLLDEESAERDGRSKGPPYLFDHPAELEAQIKEMERAERAWKEKYPDKPL